IGRRVVIVTLDDAAVGKRWDRTCMSGSAANWRAAYPDNAQACDLIVSAVAQYIRDNRVYTFEDFAAKLGFVTGDVLAATDQGIDATGACWRLFDAVCAAPPLTPDGDTGKRWRSPGLKLVRWAADYAANPIYSALVDILETDPEEPG